MIELVASQKNIFCEELTIYLYYSIVHLCFIYFISGKITPRMNNASYNDVHNIIKETQSVLQKYGIVCGDRTAIIAP